MRDSRNFLQVGFRVLLKMSPVWLATYAAYDAYMHTALGVFLDYNIVLYLYLSFYRVSHTETRQNKKKGKTKPSKVTMCIDYTVTSYIGNSLTCKYS